MYIYPLLFTYMRILFILSYIIFHLLYLRDCSITGLSAFLSLSIFQQYNSIPLTDIILLYQETLSNSGLMFRQEHILDGAEYFPQRPQEIWHIRGSLLDTFLLVKLLVTFFILMAITKLPNCLPQKLYQFTFPPEINEPVSPYQHYLIKLFRLCQFDMRKKCYLVKC